MGKQQLDAELLEFPFFLHGWRQTFQIDFRMHKFKVRFSLQILTIG